MTTIPTDQEWFWAEEWQAGERRASGEIAAGGLPVFDSVDGLFADLDLLELGEHASTTSLPAHTSEQMLTAATSPAERIATFARHADELAASVESLIALEEKHDGRQQTLQTLRWIATALGEQHSQLDELADQLRRAAR